MELASRRGKQVQLRAHLWENLIQPSEHERVKNTHTHTHTKPHLGIVNSPFPEYDHNHDLYATLLLDQLEVWTVELDKMQLRLT